MGGDPSSTAEPGLPASGEVSYSSAAVVKRRRLSYGKPGLLMLTGRELRFATGDPSTSWEIPLGEIVDLKKPWYGMGSYLTFRANGKYYALAFGRRGPDLASLTATGNLAIHAGGAGGIAGGLAADGAAVEQLAVGAAIGTHWFSLLRKGGAPDG